MPQADSPSARIPRGFLTWSALTLAAIGLLATRAEPSRRQRPAAPAKSPAESTGITGITRCELPTAGIASHHAAHLTQDASGRPIAFWFAGSREGATDVRILRSVFQGDTWSEPESVLDAKKASELGRRWIRKLGNPVTWRAPDGTLHLYVVTVCFGGWSGSRILHLTSPDDGRTFASADTLVASPFFNLSTLVKSPGLDLADGAALPVYHEFVSKHSLLVQLSESGGVRSIRRFCDQDNLIQPCVTRLPSGDFFAVHRRLKKLKPRIYEQSSADGLTWSAATPGPLPNPRSAVAMTCLPDGAPIVAFNDTESNRNLLRLARREPDGNWTRVAPPITSEGEVSYPSLFAAPDALHLVLTRDRTRIAHYRFPYETLRPDAEPAAPTPPAH